MWVKAAHVLSHVRIIESGDIEILRPVLRYLRTCGSKHCNADPHPSIYFAADPDQTVHFDADLDPAPTIKVIQICDH